MRRSGWTQATSGRAVARPAGLPAFGSSGRRRMDAAGNLAWEVPPGEWTLLRFGHAYNGSKIGPTPEDQRGPETDKLSKAATA